MKIGLDQIGVPAPLLLRRAVNGFIAILQPATTTIIMGIPDDMISKEAKVLLLALSSYIGTFFKWIEYVIGTDPATIESVKEGEPK
jgi:hypothetical protein